jgi:acetyl/propionyl-CoA carboxylase alpha subunit
MIRRLLIPNRGEIARRIVRACREMGIESVVAFSDADACSPAVLAADRAVRLGAPPAAESYLSIERVIDAARSCGADAVHPGYGFLAERAELAAACSDAGLVFVGPPAAAIERMGSKIGARALAASAGVPIVPGQTPRDQSTAGVRAAALAAGLPVVIKPAAGGGGKGMRTVRSAAGLDEAVEAARRESTSAFGDGTLYVERLIERPRHVEVQIFADGRGGTVHLFERECSIQRRHQKIIEESPAVVVTGDLRDRMGAAAIRVAEAAGYRNAGTVEFLLDTAGSPPAFYFLEMNTRLQVEHPVTEQVTGVDLVRAQLLVAGGGQVPWSQPALGLRGHAIECRLYAEDPHDLLPQAGRILLYREPSGPGIRVDSGVVEGSEITLFYDPLLAKLVATAETRMAAIARSLEALRSFPVLGVQTNVPLLMRLLDHPRFRSGDLDTGFLDTERDSLVIDGEPPASAIAAAVVWRRGRERVTQAASPTSAPDPWDTLSGWRG